MWKGEPMLLLLVQTTYPVVQMDVLVPGTCILLFDAAKPRTEEMIIVCI